MISTRKGKGQPTIHIIEKNIMLEWWLKMFKRVKLECLKTSKLLLIGYQIKLIHK